MKNMKKVIFAMTLLLAMPVARAQHCDNADVDMTAVYNKLSPNTITLPWLMYMASNSPTGDIRMCSC